MIRAGLEHSQTVKETQRVSRLTEPAIHTGKDWKYDNNYVELPVRLYESYLQNSP